MGVEGNDKADEAAKETAEKTGIRKCSERFTLLTHVGRMISEIKWKKPKHWFQTENDKRPAIQRTPYNQALENHSPDGAAMKETGYVSRRYLQLKEGHIVTDIYLHRIGKTESDRC